jgi:hypothetical protein
MKIPLSATRRSALVASLLITSPLITDYCPASPTAFLETYCFDCHDAEKQKGGLDLTALKPEFATPENFARWVKVYDRIETGEMPPKKKERPPAAETRALMTWLHGALVEAERPRLEAGARTALRRLTRAEYENTIRDLFDLPGIPLQNGLPEDGMVHGFDKNSDALDLSHVNLAKYAEAAEQVLDLAIARSPEPPPVTKIHLLLARHVATSLASGGAVLLRDGKIDPDFPPAGASSHANMRAHELAGLFDHGSSVAIFRNAEADFKADFRDFAARYPGMYRLRASFWSLLWDKGEIRPARATEAARLAVVGRDDIGRRSSSEVIGYYDAPSLHPQVHEVETWLNFKDTIGFNAASITPGPNSSAVKGKGAMAFTGPAIVSDWLEVEGPLHLTWPPASHRCLFGDLPLVEIKPVDPKVAANLARANAKAASRQRPRVVIPNKDKRPAVEGVWSVESAQPLADADRLLADFLPKAFRRPVSEAVRKTYLAKVEAQMQDGDSFEEAMRWAYGAALCSPDFLYHVEPAGPLDDHALACRLSYFLWNSMPDAKLSDLALAGKLHQPGVLRAEVERLLEDPKSQRFIEDFLGQWLKLYSIAANDPDKKLYPEFTPYLQDSMLAESHAYFRELIAKDLDAGYLVRSDFAMLNEKLAQHYGIPGVSGSQIRRVALPPGSPRGAFLTQAAVLKVTANGTTTSPVVRGAFVMSRLLGRPPEPPPANVPAVEPDVQGTTTIREQLAKHRSDPSCASCHATIDPPGFALETFDVIGGQRTHYRSVGEGERAPRGNIDPTVHIAFSQGPPVDPSGTMPGDRKFSDLAEFQSLLASDTPRLLRNLTEQLALYATGREIAFRERDEINAIVARTEQRGGGLRTLLHELVESRLFRSR